MISVYLNVLLLASIVIFLPFHLKLSGYKALLKLHPFFVIFVLLSYLFPVLSLCWLIFCLMSAGYGISRFILRGGFYIEETVIDVSIIYLFVGGIWFVASRMNLTVLGFSGLTTLLTAIHFHYSSLFSLFFLGLLGREIKKTQKLPKWYVIAANILIFSPILIGIGISISRLVEVFSVILYVLTLFVYAFTSLKLKSISIKISSSTLFFTMILPVLYMFRFISVPLMIYFHGTVNTLLFVGLGLIGYCKLTPKSHFPIQTIPTSFIVGDKKIGVNFFKRKDMMEEVEQQPRGMVDSMSIFDRKDFSHRKIAPIIQDFYENTIDYDMDVKPKWSCWFFPIALLYKYLSVQMEQMNFPTWKNEQKVEVKSEMYKIKDGKDGRENVRAWVRSDKTNQKAIYVAAYSTHLDNKNERNYNVYFPLPYGGMTSVLSIHHFGDSGVSLSSFSSKRVDEHSGVYLRIGKKVFRLPINEVINVWEERNTVKACHVGYVCGIRALELHYFITKKDR